MSEWKLFPVKLEPPNLLAPSKIDFTVDFFLGKIFSLKNRFLSKRSSSLEVFYEKGVFKNFLKFILKHLCQRPFLNTFEDLRPAILLK